MSPPEYDVVVFLLYFSFYDMMSDMYHLSLTFMSDLGFSSGHDWFRQTSTLFCVCFLCTHV